MLIENNFRNRAFRLFNTSLNIIICAFLVLRWIAMKYLEILKSTLFSTGVFFNNRLPRRATISEAMQIATLIKDFEEKEQRIKVERAHKQAIESNLRWFDENWSKIEGMQEENTGLMCLGIEFEEEKGGISRSKAPAR